MLHALRSLFLAGIAVLPGMALAALPPLAESIPATGAVDIDEQQVFLFRAKGPVDAKTFIAHVFCDVEGVRSAVEVRVIGGARKTEALKASGIDNAENWIAFRCNQTLPTGAAVQIRWDAASAATRQAVETLRYKVRDDDWLELRCPRENAKSGCNPAAPVQLYIRRALDRKDVQRFRLRDDAGKLYAPRADETDADSANFGRLPPETRFTLVVPPNLKEEGTNTPLISKRAITIRTSAVPPLIKFSRSFGIVERLADPVLPFTIRNLEPAASGSGTAALIRKLHVTNEADMIRWYARTLGMQQADRSMDDEESDYSGFGERAKSDADARGRSLLRGVAQAKSLPLPSPGGAKEFEVVGLPLAEPGLHVVEAESSALGASLLGKKAPMYVRAVALVTNLGVHVKVGSAGTLAWVTRLNDAGVVADATVRIRDCKGAEIASGRTDRDGLARLTPKSTKNRDACPNFVFAESGDDIAFTRTDWTRGIESWRFNLPWDYEFDDASEGRQLVHTVLPRNLLRPGETVYMKHYARDQRRFGTAAPDVSKLAKTLSMINEGNNERSSLKLEWSARGNALTTLRLPNNARRGQYRIEINGRTTARFTVADFRLPVYKAEVSIPEANAIGGDTVAFDARLSFLSGGPASGDVVTVRSRIDPRTWPGFDGLSEYSFTPTEDETPDSRRKRASTKGQPGGEDQTVTLSDGGGVRVPLATSPIARPHTLIADLEYRDPNGEIYTAQARSVLWPAATLIGIRTDDWAMARDKLVYHLISTDITGKPVAGVKFAVRGVNRVWNAYRKRNIGGFYSYETNDERRDLGVLCEGTTDRNGRFTCTSSVTASGEVELTADVADARGRHASASASVWAANGDDWMWRSESSDRIDLLPEKKRYEPNEKARFQVRMPFREATVLVTVERDGGVLSSFVTRLAGKNAIIEVPLKEEWAPNVYVSALLVRGRLGSPAPTALVDLGKPAFKLGLTNIDVAWKRYGLDVQVTSDKTEYQTRDKAQVRVKVNRSNNGKPGDNAELAVFAIDEALLELQGNNTWKLLDAMMRRRDHNITTATAQMQVIGKRHYGRKALPPGGSGGRGAGTRELFDTLLLWQGTVQTDGNGEASVEIPLNDSLTRFRIVAVADAYGERFGTGETSIRSTRDLQLFSGLPAVVRHGDQYRAAVTLRNSTQREITTEASGDMGGKALAKREQRIGAGQSAILQWDVIAPGEGSSVTWNFAANEKGKARGDALRVTQTLQTPLPIRTLAEANAEIKGKSSLRLKPDANVDRGELLVSLARTYGTDTSGIRAYFARYPFACLEQRMTKAMGTKDPASWEIIANSLGNYLSPSGLAHYYPGATDEGYPALTAFVLAGANEAAWELPDAARERMLSGLERYVAGDIKTSRSWLPSDGQYLLSEKLIALEALSRYGRVSKRLLDTIRVDPVKLTAASLADWLDILNRSADIADRAALRRAAMAELRDNIRVNNGVATIARSDNRWYFMRSDDYTMARMFRLSLETKELAEYRLPLLRGLNNRMHRGGYFYGTQANLWAAFALEKYARLASADGRTRVTFRGETKELVWDNTITEGELRFAWPVDGGELTLEHLGSGMPWARAQVRAPVPLTGRIDNGIGLSKTFRPVQQKRPGRYSVGDVIQVTVTADNKTGVGWLAIDDPVPAGSTVLGGLSKLANISEPPRTWQGYRYVERTFTSVRTSFEWASKGSHSVSYDLRLTTPGRFALPATHAEALYAPEVNGDLGNVTFEIDP
ncbi:MAG: hypothetical protein LC098_13230 [Burkholderiales bacterium]|nr:hypothetical protein [Burkholderiales bacterium]